MGLCFCLFKCQKDHTEIISSSREVSIIEYMSACLSVSFPWLAVLTTSALLNIYCPFSENTNLCDVTPPTYVEAHRCFAEKYCLHLQCRTSQARKPARSRRQGKSCFPASSWPKSESNSKEARKRRQKDLDLFFDLSFYTEDGSDTILQNVGCFSPNYTVSHPSKTEVFSK